MSKWSRKLTMWWIARPVHRFDEIDGYLSPAEAKALYECARRVPKNATIVEIGSWKGRSTYCLARGTESGRVYAIDPFDTSGDAESEPVYRRDAGDRPLLDQFRANMKRLDVAAVVEPRQGRSEDFHDAFDAIDLLFIDGDHGVEATRYDYETFSPRIAPGGCILFHDYHPAQPQLGPTWVVDNLVIPSGAFGAEGRVDSLWIGRKL